MSAEAAGLGAGRGAERATPLLPMLGCSGCGAVVPGDAADPFRCPEAGRGDGRDHVLSPDPAPAWARFADRAADQPFVRYRELLWTYRLARARGLTDGEWIARVTALDGAIAEVDGHGFRSTPCAPHLALADALSPRVRAVWVKDETGNVSGSHKARHLMGLALLLEVRELTGLSDPAERATRELAIASCGNAALAAAVVARATLRPLRVFIPGDANPRVIRRLDALGARIQVCPRREGEAGDPCLHAFHRAVAGGAVPFAVQGSENGLTIEGGMTLAWEMAESFATRGEAPDRLFVQTGGGALASACVTGLGIAVAHGVLPRQPRLHVVQTHGAYPLRRAWERVAARALDGSEDRARGGLGDGVSAAADLARAEALRSTDRVEAASQAMRHARAHRACYMWPWESTPRSVAHGILDDETYDWAQVVEGTIESGGWPVTVSEDRLRRAHALARGGTGIAADATGTAGLAGLLELSSGGAIAGDERIALVFSGVER